MKYVLIVSVPGIVHAAIHHILLQEMEWVEVNGWKILMADCTSKAIEVIDETELECIVAQCDDKQVVDGCKLEAHLIERGSKMPMVLAVHRSLHEHVASNTPRPKTGIVAAPVNSSELAGRIRILMRQ